MSKFKTMINQLKDKGLMLILGLFILTSCQDLYFEDMREEYYTRNFIKEFGLVDPEQDWNMAKACQLSINLGQDKASSVKIYCKYDGKYYICANLKNVKGKVKVPVDVPKSSEEILVKVDGRSYTGTINQTIDCTGATSVVSREAGDVSESRLIGLDNIRLGQTNNYDPASWTHGSSNVTYNVTANGGLSASITVGTTAGELLYENRPDAVYAPNHAYQVINTQQVAPLVSKVPWTNYYSIGRGMTDYAGDKSRGFVPEGGVGGTVDGDSGMNNSYGNTKNDGVVQDFYFDLKGDMFTVYPMFYGTNLVHILGFYLLDENEKPILDSDGKVMKFPIYKTKQDDDMYLRLYPDDFKYISISQADGNGNISVSEGSTKNLTLRLWKDNNVEVTQVIDYSQVQITNTHTSNFTIRKGTNNLALQGISECKNQPVTITYQDVSTTLYVTVSDPNEVFNLRVNGLTSDDAAEGANTRLDVYAGEPYKLDITFLNSAGEAVTLTDAQYAAALQTVRWQEQSWITDCFTLERRNDGIYVIGKQNNQWVRLWINGKGAENEDGKYTSIHVYVTDRYASINPGIINSSSELIGNEGITLAVGGEPVTLRLVDVTNSNSTPVEVQNLPDGAAAKITHTTTSHCTISSIGSDCSFTVTPTSGGEETVTFTLGSKTVALKVNVTDPNALNALKLYNGSTPAVEIPSDGLGDLNKGDEAYFYVKRVSVQGAEDNLSDEEWEALTVDGGDYCTAEKTGTKGEIKVTGTAEGYGSINVNVNGKTKDVSVHVVDPNKLQRIVVIDNNAEVTEIGLRVNQSATLTVKGEKQSDSSLRDLTDDEWTALTATFSTTGICTATKGNNGTLNVVAGNTEGTTNMTISTGSVSTSSAIAINVTDPAKVSGLKLVNVDGSEITSTIYLEPGVSGFDTKRVKVVGLNGNNETVALTPEQLSGITLECLNPWNDTDIDNFTAVFDTANPGEIILTGVTKWDNVDPRFRVKSGNITSNVINVAINYSPDHTVNSFTVNNANMSNGNGGTGFVVKVGNTIAIDIEYKNANGYVLDPAIGIKQVDLNNYNSNGTSTITKGDEYFIVTGVSEGNQQIQFTVNWSQITIYVVAADSELTESANPSGYTNPAPKRNNATAANNTKAKKANVNKSKNADKPVIKTKPLGVKAADSNKPEVKFERKKSRTVRFITPKEQKKVAKQRDDQRKKEEKKYASRAMSRAGEEVPAKFRYETDTDNRNDKTKWGPINKVWQDPATTGLDVNSFLVNTPQLALVKGFDVKISGDIPHKKVGLYIDVLDNPDITNKEDCYYTGLYRGADDKYPTDIANNCPFPYTHYSQKGLNVYIADDRDAKHVTSLTSGETKFEFSYAAAYTHPISNRWFFSFEDWRIKHPSEYDKDITGSLSGYEYENKDFWGTEDSKRGDDEKQKFTGDYSSDRDLNDLVFVIYGAESAVGDKKITTTEDDEFSWIWAVEDLGATDDFDFNDLVMRVTSVTENIDIEKNNGGIEGDTSDDSLKFFKKVTFQPLCAGGTLPLFVHYGDYTLKPGEYVGQDIIDFYEGQPEDAEFEKPYGINARNIDELINPAQSQSEIHKWFGSGYNHNVMLNTGFGPDVSLQDIKPCVIYICMDHYKGFTLADFATDTDIKPTVQSSNKSGLYVNVNDDRGDQYDDDNPIYDPGSEIGTEEGAWSVTPPTEPGKVSQMFMISGSSWRWPRERCHILEAYPRFKDWVNSHKNNIKWYDYNSLNSTQKANCY